MGVVKVRDDPADATTTTGKSAMKLGCHDAYSIYSDSIKLKYLLPLATGKSHR